MTQGETGYPALAPFTVPPSQDGLPCPGAQLGQVTQAVAQMLREHLQQAAGQLGPLVDQFIQRLLVEAQQLGIFQGCH